MPRNIARGDNTAVFCPQDLTAAAAEAGGTNRRVASRYPRAECRTVARGEAPTWSCFDRVVYQMAKVPEKTLQKWFRKALLYESSSYTVLCGGDTSSSAFSLCMPHSTSVLFPDSWQSQKRNGQLCTRRQRS